MTQKSSERCQFFDDSDAQFQRPAGVPVPATFEFRGKNYLFFHLMAKENT